jgi:hypothetical protein
MDYEIGFRVKNVFLGSFMRVPIPRVGDLVRMHGSCCYKVEKVEFFYLHNEDGDGCDVFVDLVEVEE